MSENREIKRKRSPPMSGTEEGFKIKRKRATPTSKTDEILLLDLIEANKAVLLLKDKKAEAVLLLKDKKAEAEKRKTDKWNEICHKINAQSTTKQTVKQVKKIWERISMKGREENSMFIKETKKTGGGPQPKPITTQTQKVVDIFGDKNPILVGLHGFESGLDVKGSLEYLDTDDADSKAVSSSQSTLDDDVLVRNSQPNRKKLNKNVTRKENTETKKTKLAVDVLSLQKDVFAKKLKYLDLKMATKRSEKLFYDAMLKSNIFSRFYQHLVEEDEIEEDSF